MVRSVHVDMVRQDLERIPFHPLPPGYSVRWHRPGDRALWVAIWAAAEKRLAITCQLYAKEFGADRALLADRQFFLLDGQGEAVGTATAWFGGPGRGREMGRIHWVAIVPALQGRGLSKPMMTIACERLRELGHRQAWLGTTTDRIAAVCLYRGFGFVPETRTAADRAAWRELAARLGWEESGLWI